MVDYVRPRARPMQYGENFHAASPDPVRHDEWSARRHQFTGSRHAAGPSSLGELTQAVDGGANVERHRLCRGWLVEGYVGTRFLEIGDGSPRVSDDHRQRA